MVGGGWSIMSNAAIQIGSDMTEVNHHGVMFINHDELSTFSIAMADKFKKDIQLTATIANEWNEAIYKNFLGWTSLSIL
jgi:hypothetical protein